MNEPRAQRAAANLNNQTRAVRRVRTDGGSGVAPQSNGWEGRLGGRARRVTTTGRRQRDRLGNDERCLGLRVGTKRGGGVTMRYDMNIVRGDMGTHRRWAGGGSGIPGRRQLPGG